MAAWYWQTLISSRDNLVGGDFEYDIVPEGVFRGPIKSIELSGDWLKIELEWCAHLQGFSWSVVDDTSYTLDVVEYFTTPEDIGEGRVYFRIPFGRATIFPRGGSKLNPGKVEGLVSS